MSPALLHGASDAPRILIVRLSALGDIVFAGCLLDALRQRFPRAHLGWLVARRFAGLLDGDPRLDARIVVDDSRLAHPSTLLALRRELAAQRFDWVIDAQGLAKSRLLALLAPGARRIGFQSKEPGAWLFDHVLPKGGDIRDFASEYRDLARRLTGLDTPPGRVEPGKADRQRLRQQLASLGLAPGFIAFCPFTTRPQKHWLDAHWLTLGARLHAAGAPPIAVLGGPAERAHAQALVDQLPPGSVNLAGQTRLGDLPACLAEAALVIGVDTGLTHLGVALRRPVLALFGSTVPYTRAADDAPFTLLYRALPCSPCKRRPTCGGAYTCMREISGDDAALAALKLLAADQ